MFVASLVVFVLAVIVARGVDAASPSQEDGVYVLTKDNFDAFVNAEDLTVVEFYAPWCGHCKSLAPEYAKAAKKLSGKIKLAKVDATVETSLGERFHVQGYPTLKIFRKGVASEYKGGRTADTIISYMEKQSMPALTTLSTASAASDFSKSSSVVIVGVFASASGEAYSAFDAVVKELREEFVFGEIIDATVAASAFGVVSSDIPSIIMFKQYDEPKTVYTGAFSSSDISKWIKSEAIPLLDDISQENYKMYMDSGLPLAWIFFDPADTNLKASISKDISPIAKETRGKINWCFCDGVRYGGQAKNLGLSGDFLPSLAINSPTDQHYAFPGKDKLTRDEVQSWVNDFLNAKISPTIKSQPEPTSQDGPVYVLVGSAFERVVYDPTKDVLVEFYAPWCGHCKSLAPIYDQLGEKYKDVDSLIIAKMDATENDAAGMGIQGFPTIKFFPARPGREVVNYEGSRDLDGFVSFLNANVAIPIVHGSKKTHSHGEEL